MQGVESPRVQTVHWEIVPVPQIGGTEGRTGGKIAGRSLACVSDVQFHLDQLTSRKKIITQTDTSLLDLVVFLDFKRDLTLFYLTVVKL